MIYTMDLPGHLCREHGKNLYPDSWEAVKEAARKALVAPYPACDDAMEFLRLRNGYPPFNAFESCHHGLGGTPCLDDTDSIGAAFAAAIKSYPQEITWCVCMTVHAGNVRVNCLHPCRSQAK